MRVPAFEQLKLVKQPCSEDRASCSRWGFAQGIATTEMVSNECLSCGQQQVTGSRIPSQWLGDRASQIQQPVSFHGGECSASQGVRLGFNSLRDVKRGWGIESPEGLSQWLRQHIPARGQEDIFALGCTVDAAFLEAVT